MIVRAAIIGHDGEVYTLPQPKRHHDIIGYMVNALNHPAPIVGEQGFWDDELGFLARPQAYHRAIDLKQVEKTNTPGLLFSEDLW